MTVAHTTDAAAVEAVQRQRLAQWATDHADAPGDRQQFAAQAAATCDHIGREVGRRADEVVALLRAAGVGVEAGESGSPRQRHTVTMRVDSFDDADRAVSLLELHGFVRWDSWKRGAAESFRRTTRELTVAHTAEHSLVVRFRWGDDHPLRLRQRLTTPTTGDWRMLDVPKRLWWVYPFVRPIRQALERTGRRDPLEAGLGPFLSTPESLIPALFELAEIGSGDVLLDIGCGDGRLVAAAASMVGCRAVGVELEASLAAAGRERIAELGLDDLATIEHDDGRGADVSAATVVFMFLPMNVVSDLVRPTLELLPPGATLVVHEQTPLDARLTPDRSIAVVSDDAVTVAHIWTKDRSPAGRG